MAAFAHQASRTTAKVSPTSAFMAAVASAGVAFKGIGRGLQRLRVPMISTFTPSVLKELGEHSGLQDHSPIEPSAEELRAMYARSAASDTM